MPLLAVALAAVMQVSSCRAQQPYNPLVNVPVNLWFCGPVVAGDRITYTLTLDGVAQPAQGWLTRNPGDVNADGLTGYSSSEAVITLATPGLHTLRIVYGGQTVTVTLMGATCSPTPIGGFIPPGAPMLNCP